MGLLDNERFMFLDKTFSATLVLDLFLLILGRRVFLTPEKEEEEDAGLLSLRSSFFNEVGFRSSPSLSSFLVPVVVVVVL